MIDWTQIILALILALPAIIAAWKATKAVQKIEDNTVITEKAATVAAATANKVEVNRQKTADIVAQKVSEGTEDLKKMLNGALDKRIKDTVSVETEVISNLILQVSNSLNEHIEKDDKQAELISASLSKLLENSAKNQLKIAELAKKIGVK